MFLNFINYFRGFAILLIVIGHLFGTVKVFNYDNPYLNTIFTKSIFSLISGGTSLFVFISGFLFHHVFYSRGFNFKKFLINKLKNVLSPYLVLMTPLVIYQLLYVPRYQKLHSSTGEFLKYLFLSLYSGTMLLSTWYIPFAFLLFLSSPLFIKFINSHKSILIYKGFDIVIFQKFFMCLYLVLFFNKFEIYFSKSCKKIFDILAEYSFPIFFLHNYVIQFIYPAIGFEKESGYIGLILLTVLTLLLSIAFAFIIKKIFKKNSRYIIGG
ncbi:acyltransferase family protein [Cetobacterium sp.]|uniref:acyltransferase family protein n=1 Tax=Cetobacterium sp. TaxID=2071632 RepID=UPI003F2B5FD9